MGILQAVQGKSYSNAVIKGDNDNPGIIGEVEFIPWSKGSIIKLEIMGLPKENNENNFFAFHIHKIANCNNDKKNFPNTGEHYTKFDEKHPNHTGDLPMIYSNNGYSFMIYYTSRFTPQDVVGKAIVIHKNMDDMETQPSGNSGVKIACGEIIKVDEMH